MPALGASRSFRPSLPVSRGGFRGSLRVPSWGVLPRSPRRLFAEHPGVGQHRRKNLSRVTALKAASVIKPRVRVSLRNLSNKTLRLSDDCARRMLDLLRFRTCYDASYDSFRSHATSSVATWRVPRGVVHGAYAGPLTVLLSLFSTLSPCDVPCGYPDSLPGFMWEGCMSAAGSPRQFVASHLPSGMVEVYGVCTGN